MPSPRPYRDGWRVQIQKDGVRISETFRLKKDAVAWINQQEAKKTLQVSKPLSAAVKKYLESVSSQKADAVKWETRRFDEFMAYEDEELGVLRDVPLEDIDSAALGRWRDQKLASASGSTVIRYFNLYRNLFKIAHEEWKWIEEYPFKGVRLPKENAPRKALWTTDLVARVLEAPRTGKTAEMQLAFKIALETGMRLQEVLASPGCISGQVVEMRTKTEAMARIPVSEAGAEMIRSASFTVGANEGSVLFSKLCREIGVKDLTFHDARATALTRLAKTLDVLELARVSRHKDINILLNTYYRETAEEIAKKL